MIEKIPPLSRRMIRKRSDFLEASRGFRAYCSCFGVQTPNIMKVAAPFSRFGLTVTKKTGNAPARNRIKRRLRAAIREITFSQDADYVIIARRETLSRDFASLQHDLSRCLRKLRRMKDGSSGSKTTSP